MRVCSGRRVRAAAQEASRLAAAVWHCAPGLEIPLLLRTTDFES